MTKKCKIQFDKIILYCYQMIGENTYRKNEIPDEAEELQTELARRCCVRTNYTSRCVYFSFQTIRLCCEKCFDPFDFFITEPIFKYTDLHVCTPIGSIPLICYCCGRYLLHIKPMYECHDCYNYYLQIENQNSSDKNNNRKDNRRNLSDISNTTNPFPEINGMPNYYCSNSFSTYVENEFKSAMINENEKPKNDKK